MLAILAAVMLAAAPQQDTVHTANGGRLVGTVIEEGPQTITIQLPDGTMRRLARSEVARIEYSDGSVSTPNRPAPPAQPPAYRAPPQPPPYAQPPQPPPRYAPPPPPAYRPPPPPHAAPPAYPPAPPPQPAYARGQAPLSPFYGSFGLGGLFLNGDAAGGVPMSQVFGSQLGLWLDGGIRLTSNVGLGLYYGYGIGEPASEVESACAVSGTSCTASTSRFGVMLRHTFDPYARSTPWIGIGTGWEWGRVTLDDYGSGEEYFSFSGWEMLRLMGGVDLRSSPVFGVGLYAGVSFGRYSQYREPPAALDYAIGEERTHATVEAGLRFTLFP
ncbi:MAG TPA: hypothetical protein VFL83_15990 [Anaeromyxobacter sp.]|nr:hypothetical protein [Anaeromyxobacter sp.]